MNIWRAHVSQANQGSNFVYFYWPSVAGDCRRYIQTCRTCQLKARVTYRDRVRIALIECLTAGLLTVPVLSSLARESQKVEYN